MNERTKEKRTSNQICRFFLLNSLRQYRQFVLIFDFFYLFSQSKEVLFRIRLFRFSRQISNWQFELHTSRANSRLIPITLNYNEKHMPLVCSKITILLSHHKNAVLSVLWWSFFSSAFKLVYCLLYAYGYIEFELCSLSKELTRFNSHILFCLFWM